MGWDIENPEEVQPNIRTEGGDYPDYTILKDNNKILTIEVKNLSKDILKEEDPLRQLGNYCYVQGVKYGILTNGIVWRIIKSFEEGKKLPEREILKIDIESEDAPLCARKLGVISKEAIDTLENETVKIRAFEEIWKSYLNDPKEIKNVLKEHFKITLKEGYPEVEYEEEEIEEFLEEKMEDWIKQIEKETEEIEIVEQVEEPEEFEETSLQELKIDNDIFEIKSARDILIKTAEWLIQQGKLKEEDCPLPAGSIKSTIRYLVNKEPVHKNGKPFRAGKKLSNGLFIETHYSRADIIRLSRSLLDRYGFQGDILKIS